MKQTKKNLQYIFCPRCSYKLKVRVVDKEKAKACQKCDFVFWNNPKPSVSVIIHNKDKVLMLRRAYQPLKGYWVLPGGFIRHDETPEEAIKRETKEEIGVSIQVEGIVGAYRVDNDPRGVHIDIIYRGKIKDEVKLSDENDDWKYFNIQDLPQKIAYRHKTALKDWTK